MKFHNILYNLLQNSSKIEHIKSFHYKLSPLKFVLLLKNFPFTAEALDIDYIILHFSVHFRLLPTFGIHNSCFVMLGSSLPENVLLKWVTF